MVARAKHRMVLYAILGAVSTQLLVDAAVVAASYAVSLQQQLLWLIKYVPGAIVVGTYVGLFMRRLDPFVRWPWVVLASGLSMIGALFGRIYITDLLLSRNPPVDDEFWLLFSVYLGSILAGVASATLLLLLGKQLVVRKAAARPLLKPKHAL